MRTVNLSLSSVPAHSSDSVSIVFDGWNAVLGASEGFGYSRRQLSTFTLDLPRLADRIAGMRHHSSRVERIAVVMGTHNRRANPAAHTAQAAAARQWKRDPRVTVIDPGMEQLNEPTVGEGVVVPLRRHCEVRGDAEIQRMLTEWTDDRKTDVAILVSADADHLSTVTDIRRRRRTHLEVARWEWQWSSLWERGLWVHHLGHDLLDSVTSDCNPRKAA